MEKIEFRKKVAKWLEKEGLCIIGDWEIEEIDDSDRIVVKIKINGNDKKSVSITENKEETIETAVLALNDLLINKLNEQE